jgi:hypothetical protein
MVPQKYIDLGFEITRFGAQSKVLRYGQKPVFVFNTNSDIDPDFLICICDTYLRIAEKRKNLSCIRA